MSPSEAGSQPIPVIFLPATSSFPLFMNGTTPTSSGMRRYAKTGFEKRNDSPGGEVVVVEEYCVRKIPSVALVGKEIRDRPVASLPDGAKADAIPFELVHHPPNVETGGKELVLKLRSIRRSKSNSRMVFMRRALRAHISSS